ncbi:fimbrial protein [Pseudomonas sp. RA_105y_Pfl2_P56]|uniref:fimbrial protein n=1 Tax=Pseudomonas sp. RA_105y_Pfl2_P56 TaxID=3088701 RepID=UPI0030D93186
MKHLSLSLFAPFYLILSLAPQFAHAANCSFYPGHKLGLFNIDIPTTLSIPRDTPNGTVIYESAPVATYTDSSYKCTNNFFRGVKNNVGETTPGSLLMPIGNTGIAWQWLLSSPLPGYPGQTRKAGGYGWNGSIHTLTLVKIGDINGTTKIPAGTLGYVQSDEVISLGMTTRGMTITPQSCETPDVKVDMGSTDLSVFSEQGKHSTPVRFSIKLNNCPQGINQISYTLTATSTSPAINASAGIIGLNNSSTAKGISLQLLDEQLQPLNLNKRYLYNGYSGTSGSFNIPLNAQFVRVLPTGKKGGFDPGMSPGTANADVWFIMNYL